MGDAARESTDHDRFVAHVDGQVERVIVLRAGHALGPVPRTAARDARKHRICASGKDRRLGTKSAAGLQGGRDDDLVKAVDAHAAHGVVLAGASRHRPVARAAL